MNMIEGWVKQIEHHNQYRQWARIENRNRISLYRGSWHQYWQMYLQLKGEFSGPRFVADTTVFDVMCYGSHAWRVDAQASTLRATPALQHWLRSASGATWGGSSWPWCHLLPGGVYARYDYATRHQDGYTYLTGLRGPDCMVNEHLALHIGEHGVEVVEGFEPCPDVPLVTPERTLVVRRIFRRLRNDLLAYDPMRDSGGEYPPDHPFGMDTLETLRNDPKTFDHIVDWALGSEGYDYRVHAMVVSNVYRLHKYSLQSVLTLDDYKLCSFKKRIRAYVYTGQ